MLFVSADGHVAPPPWAMREYLESAYHSYLDEYTVDQIPCFALRFGTDAEVAAKVIRFLLAEVYGYKAPTTFECEVHDEGEVE